MIPRNLIQILVYLDILEATPENVRIDRNNYIPLLLTLTCLINKITDDLYVGLHDYQVIMCELEPYQYTKLFLIEGYLSKCLEYHLIIPIAIEQQYLRALSHLIKILQLNDWDNADIYAYQKIPVEWHMSTLTNSKGIG